MIRYNTRQKSWDTLHIFNVDKTFVPTPPKQCWFLGEVYGVMDNFFVCNNAKCLRYRPTLF